MKVGGVMIPLLILVGMVIGLCRPYRSVGRCVVALLALAGAGILWGVVVAVGDQVVDPDGVGLAVANGAVGWLFGAVLAGAASAVSMLARTTR